MAHAEGLKELIGLFPPAKEGTIMRGVLFMITEATYLTEQNKAVANLWYGSPPEIEHEFFNLGDYWENVMATLQRAPRLGEKAKAVFGFEHALHTYFQLKMSEEEQRNYKGLYDKIQIGLQTLMASMLGQARALEESGQLRYVIFLSAPPRKGIVAQGTGERQNFQVLEDKLFLDPDQLRRLKNFLWSDAARSQKPCLVELTRLEYKLPQMKFT